MFSNFFQIACRFYEIMRKSTVEPDMPQVTIWHVHIVCCIINDENAHSEYVVPIAFLMQRWLHKCASLLHYTYITCLVRF